MVVRTHNEADRLRLTLASLAGQAGGPAGGHEVVVVVDGATDHTAEVLAAAPLPVRVVRHAVAQGRAAAANAGARLARGRVLLFLDGDTLAGPGMLAAHAALHATPGLMGRGDTWHLRQTRLLRDPDSGMAFPQHAASLARRPAAERERLRVTVARVQEDFASLAAQAEPGIYPGAGPRLLQEVEMAALRETPGCGVLWAAASGSNFSVPRDAFLRVGGFDAALSINEHRELALRLAGVGLGVAPVPAARSYHMIHRSGWRDPLVETGWEATFLAAHPRPAVALLAVFWASLAPAAPLPVAERIASLPELEQAAASGRGFDAARLALGLPALGAAFWGRA